MFFFFFYLFLYTSKLFFFSRLDEVSLEKQYKSRKLSGKENESIISLITQLAERTA